MMILLRQFPDAISIHHTLPEAKRVQDGFVIADGIHYVHRFHFDHPRAQLAFNDESNAGLLQRRFDEIQAIIEYRMMFRIWNLLTFEAARLKKTPPRPNAVNVVRLDSLPKNSALTSSSP